LNVRYEKTIDFATMIIVKGLFKDDKKLISYCFFTVNQYHTVKNCVTEKKLKNKKVKKEILASLTSSCPWLKLSLLIVGTKMSSSPRKSRQDVRRKVCRVKMSHTQILLCKHIKCHVCF